MKCRKCDKFIPQSVGNCPHCKTFYGLENEPLPSTDKYGLPTKIIPIDSEKSKIRENYITSMEMRKNNFRKETFHISDNYNVAYLIETYPVLLFFFFLLSALIAIVFPMEYRIIALLIVFPTLSISGWVALAKIKKKQDAVVKIKNSNLQRDSHKKFDERNSYYESEKVIGFSMFDHMKYEDENLVKYYTYYEIDRENITEITYDSESACYVIHTSKPVYQNYSQQPTCTLYWADVFNDTVLTNALKHNLPPKQTNF